MSPNFARSISRLFIVKIGKEERIWDLIFKGGPMHRLNRQELNTGGTLPAAYGTHRIVLLPQTPHALFTYWEITPGLTATKQKEYGPAWTAAPVLLRVRNADLGTATDMQITAAADSWHVPVSNADCLYYVELGRLLPGNCFIPLVTSNIVRTPRDSISSVIDPRWKMFAFWQHKFYRRMQHGLSSYLPPLQKRD